MKNNQRRSERSRVGLALRSRSRASEQATQRARAEATHGGEDLALLLYKEGNHIVYCDIEGIAKIDQDAYLLDECGHWCYVDQQRFKLEEQE